jgi:RNA polymerase sigma-B factor
MRSALVDVDAAHRAYAESRDRHLEAQLLRYHEPLAVHLANRFTHRGESTDDLRQVALLAMLRALRSYDPDRGAQFSTYAVPSIVGALKRHFRDRAWLVRPPRRIQETYLIVHEVAERLHEQLGRSPSVHDIAEDAGLTDDEVLESLEASGGRRPVPLEAPLRSDDDRALETAASDGGGPADEADDRLLAAELVKQLSADERDVIVLSFFSQLTQKQIAARLGTSQSTVSRTRRQALDRLRALHEGEVDAA